MKQTLQLAVAGLVLAGAASAARADLTISGAVGLPLNPTAQIPAQEGIRLQGNYFDHGTSGTTDFKGYGIYGAGRVADGLEINGGYGKFDSDPDSNFDKTGLAIGAKYLFSRESDPAGVRLAAGAGYDRTLLKNTYAYLVATKYLGEISDDKVPVTGHLGLRYDKFKLANDSSKVSVYGGVEVPLTRKGEFQAVGELQSKNVDNGKMPYSASLRYRPKASPFGVSVGIARQGLTTDSGLFAQVGYTFGTK